jgi:hypothetical protein
VPWLRELRPDKVARSSRSLSGPSTGRGHMYSDKHECLYEDRKPFIDGCSAAPTAAGIAGARVNHDQGSLKPCANQNLRARPA